MSFRDDQLKALQAPLNATHVKTRQQAGRNLSYVEAWHAIAEANRIFGFDRWDRETVELIPLGEPRLVGDKYRVGYRAKVKVTVYTADGDPTVREGCGFGSGIDKDPDQAHESALKEAESDAMKRALMTFGNPFGLALYDKQQANVSHSPVEPPPTAPDFGGGRKSAAQAKRDGDNEKIKADIAKCDRAGLQDWHENFETYTAHLPISWLDSVRDMLEHRLEELNGAERVRDADSEMTRAYRGTLGAAA